MFKLCHIGSCLVLAIVFFNEKTQGGIYLLRQPQEIRYEWVRSKAPLLATPFEGFWLCVQQVSHPKTPVYLGDRVVLSLSQPEILPTLLLAHGLQHSRRLNDHTFILQAPDALAALEAAASLGQFPGVRSSHPVIRRSFSKRGNYSMPPDDPYFLEQWNLDQRDAKGQARGADLNVRSAWPISQGAGVVIAIGDEGFQLDHPDLESPANGQPHFNFFTKLEEGSPYDDFTSIPPVFADHGTAVAGLAGARGNNKVGISGIAPQSGLASWIVLGAGTITDEDVMDMYQYQSNRVAVQNHSWGVESPSQVGLTTLEDLGIENAVTQGRQGRGVVMVRAAGNNKGAGYNTNDETEISDARVIAVAAMRQDGRVTSYSTRGASILVAAPSGDPIADFPNVISTDRTGADGYNMDEVSGDYVFGDAGFNGTSAASPQIAGVVALMLSANSALRVRDVQQILILSARHLDLADPDLRTNSAGFRVSHNLGFGLPDAGLAVRLAQAWALRPAQMMVAQTNAEALLIPEKPSLEIKGVPGHLFPDALSSLGPEAVADTPFLTLIDIGKADGTYTGNLHGKAAFIQRGDIYFYEKIENAFQLGAQFAIIYNNRAATDIFVMGRTDFTPIPTVFIGQNDGEDIGRVLSTSEGFNVQARLLGANPSNAATYRFPMTTPMLLEHVKVTLDSAHPRRGDLRVTLVSPSGTSSLLQFKNTDDSPGPIAWTYISTHHFFESSLGEWQVMVQDQRATDTGSVTSVSIQWTGTPIADSDRDGLDDTWELSNLHTLQFGAMDDPDKDGATTMREFLLGTNPLAEEVAFTLDAAPLDSTKLRLSWPSVEGATYQIWGGDTVQNSLTLLAHVLGRSTECEWITDRSIARHRFFRVVRNP